MPTQKDIADQLGVSVSLVSRVLSGKAREIGVSEDTIQRVEAAVKKHGYVPSAAARILKGAPTRTLGVVVVDFEDPFFAPVIGALQRRAHAAGYSLVLAGFERRQVSTADIQPLLKHGLDGLVIVGSHDETAWLDPFLERPLRAVRIGTGPATDRVAEVHMDEAGGIGLLLDHLTQLGHRSLAFLGANTAIHRTRLELFRAAATDRGLSAPSDWQLLADRPVGEAGEQGGRELFRSRAGSRPTALVAASDIVAAGALAALNEAGLRVPDDCSVAGFDDIPLAHLLRPALTTLAQPVDELAAAALMLALNPTEPVPGPQAFRLVPRASTAPPPGSS